MENEEERAQQGDNSEQREHSSAHDNHKRKDHSRQHGGRQEHQQRNQHHHEHRHRQRRSVSRSRERERDRRGSHRHEHHENDRRDRHRNSQYQQQGGAQDERRSNTNDWNNRQPALGLEGYRNQNTSQQFYGNNSFRDVPRAREEKKIKQAIQLKDPFSVWLRKPEDDIDRADFKLGVEEVQDFDENGNLKVPENLDSLGPPDELQIEKRRIDEYSHSWDSINLNDFELVDIYRLPDAAAKRYTAPIVNYDIKNNGRRYIFSRAYFKLWEVISEYGILERYKGRAINIATVAEGPGGFIHALIDFRDDQNRTARYYQGWKEDHYFGITLKIPPEDHNSSDWDQRFAKRYFETMREKGYNITLSYGEGDGNMLDERNLDHFLRESLQGKKCELVTGDGGIEVSGDEYEVQELCCTKLFFAEILYAFSVQSIGGTFVLKIYDSFNTLTAQLLSLLCLHYSSVRLTKPLLSRPASSERYLLCEDFLGAGDDLLLELRAIMVQWVTAEPNIGHYLQNKEHRVRTFLTLGQKNLASNWYQNFTQNIRESNADCVQSQVEKIRKGLDLLKLRAQQNAQLFQGLASSENVNAQKNQNGGEGEQTDNQNGNGEEKQNQDADEQQQDQQGTEIAQEDQQQQLQQQRELEEQRRVQEQWQLEQQREQQRLQQAIEQQEQKHQRQLEQARYSISWCMKHHVPFVVPEGVE